ncbi:MAG: hypothetical protein HYS81_01360 [Candidatus Aenigmatarchaeota archaeon]|nr:MAG: hypothetical protein HYS81_01360 [Candidatus Aenigmarchaeota archaeon]
MAKKSEMRLVVLFALVTLLGISYTILFTTPGIAISCSDKMIMGFSKVPPPLAAIAQTPICKVNVEATSESVIVCSGELNVMESPNGVFPCSNLKKFKGSTILINATFIDNDGMVYGNNVKELPFK